MESASLAAPRHSPADEHPVEANQSSRVNRAFLGMLMFIGSEVMIFAAFFTAYVFLRVVVAPPDWPPAGIELPVDVAGVNTLILLSSSVTLHYALASVRRDNRVGMKIGMGSTFLLGLTFLTIQVREYVHLGFAPHDNGFASIFYGLTGLHGAHVFIGLCILMMINVRVWRGHYSSQAHLGLEVPGIYWHFVDIMWIFVFSSLYVL